MSEALTLLLVGAAGGGLGAIFFGGLWWTVRRALSSPQPAIWALGSLALRMSIARGGFYLASQGRWQRLLACLLGFIMARALVTWLTRMTEGNRARPAREVSHAT